MTSQAWENLGNPSGFICDIDLFVAECRWANDTQSNPFSPAIPFREYSFLENPRTPVSLVQDVLQVEMCQANTYCLSLRNFCNCKWGRYQFYKNWYGSISSYEMHLDIKLNVIQRCSSQVVSSHSIFTWWIASGSWDTHLKKHDRHLDRARKQSSLSYYNVRVYRSMIQYVRAPCTSTMAQERTPWRSEVAFLSATLSKSSRQDIQ